MQQTARKVDQFQVCLGDGTVWIEGESLWDCIVKAHNRGYHPKLIIKVEEDKFDTLTIALYFPDGQKATLSVERLKNSGIAMTLTVGTHHYSFMSSPPDELGVAVGDIFYVPAIVEDKAVLNAITTHVQHWYSKDKSDFPNQEA